MGSTNKSLFTALLISSLLAGCEKGSVQQEISSDGANQYGLSAQHPDKKEVFPEDSPKPTSNDVENEETPEEKPEAYKWWMEFPWEKTVKNFTFDPEGKPIPVLQHERSYYRITNKTRTATREAHRQTAAAVGLKVTEEKTPNLAKFLTARASIEASLQGNQRPFDSRGVIHGLDVRAAGTAGKRNRKKYEEAGNEFAINMPRIFLGYGQGGMISWLFLDNWDILGDPRMLGDTVVSAMTYRRSLVEKFNMLSRSRIKCYEYDDTGKPRNHSFNGKSYRVGKHKVDQEKYDACIAEGPKDKLEKRHPKNVEHRCWINSRYSYKWKPGDEQPENTVPVPKITWWQMKRASGGRPCPPWEGDTYEKHAKQKFSKRAVQFELDISRVVRRKDLGEEPEGVNQYVLWMAIWDATIESLGEEPINWENLRSLGREKEQSFEISPEKIEQERRRARGESLNPYERKKK